MTDGSIVIWSNQGASLYSEAFCFNSQLALKWNVPIQTGNLRPNRIPSGNNFLIGAGGDLYSFWSDYSGDMQVQQGWVTKIDPPSGEPGQPSGLPENYVATSAVVTPDASEIFVVASQPNSEKKLQNQWRLMTMNPDTEKMEYRAGSEISSNNLVPLAPVATSSRLYLQVPSPNNVRRPKSADSPTAAILAFQLE